MIDSTTHEISVTDYTNENDLKATTTVKYRVEDYGNSQIPNVVTKSSTTTTTRILSVAAAVSTFQRKGEDRHSIIRITDDESFVDCQKPRNKKDNNNNNNNKYNNDVNNNINVPLMLAFAGVFDGHDGSDASEYCASGLLKHILAETTESIETYADEDENCLSIATLAGVSVSSPLDAGVMNAFHVAQARFATHAAPPTFAQVARGAPATRVRKSFLQRMGMSKNRIRRGGTAACTLSIYAQHHGASNDNELQQHQRGEDQQDELYALIANTGDCRLLCDDGSGRKDSFRQITTDHRPEEPSETARLQAYVDRGECFVDRFNRDGGLRISPGGLAVSRSIGDLRMASAVVPTPDVFKVPLHATTTTTSTSTNDDTFKEKIMTTQTIRFILACDGLWDSISNEEVAQCGARFQTLSPEEDDEAEENNNNMNDGNVNGNTMVTVSPKVAVGKIMEKCLENDGTLDDVTILVVDVTIQDA